MTSRLLACAAMALGFCWPAAAFDIDSMTEAERDAFRSEIRAYLLDNPEVLMEAFDVIEAREAEALVAADAETLRENASEIFNDPDSWTGGNPDGDISVVEFLDYRCGYCRRAHPEVVELVSSDGGIRYIVKEFPILGEQSVLASQFAISVLRQEGGEAYAEVSDRLMTFRGEFTKDALSALSDEMGFDTASVLKSMDSDEVSSIIAKNQELARRLSIRGTPTFVFEREMIRGYAPIENMRLKVAELRAAE